MSIRKLLSLLLLVVFTTVTIVPASAIVTLDNAGTTLPTLAQDAGTKANGANRDVVPVTVRVNFQASDLNFGTISGLSTNGALSSAAGNTFLTITANGKLSQADSTANGTINSLSRRALILTPPTGTKFVALKAGGYSTSNVRLCGNGAVSGLNLGNVTSSLTNVNAPGAGSNGNAILASVLTEEGPSTYFGSALAAGSIIAYFLTANTTADLNTSAADVTFTGFGLAAEPSGNTSLASSGNIAATYFTPSGASVNEALVALGNTDTVNVSALGSRSGKTEFLMLGDKTGSETTTSVEPDDQPNTVLASQLAAAGTTVNIAPGLITSTGTSLTSLNLDTDALILRGAERTDSTSTTRTYYQTPFATSAVSTSVLVANGSSGITSLNTALSDTTMFPNTTNALISVVFKAVNPSTGSVSSDATLTVNAVTVGLHGVRAFNGLRNTGASSGGSTTTLGNGGFLGAVINTVNGLSSKANYGIGVIYNGTSSSSALVVRDVTKLSYGQQNLAVGFNGRTQNTTVPKIAGALTPTVVNGGTATNGIFPASIVVGYRNGATSGATYQVVNTANGAGSAPFSFDAGTFAGDSYEPGEPIYTPSETSVRLVNSSGSSTNTNAWFILVGNDNGDSLSDRLKVGSTNISTIESYLKGIDAPTGATATDVSNNVVAVARLAGSTLQILPVSNRYDAIRDIITIRPEISLTLNDASKASGINVVAEASGGNINGTKKVTIAQILAAGSLNVATTLQTLPIGGDLSSLMQENGTNDGAGRAYIALSSITGASTTTDALADLISTGKALDSTVPPLFCGGSAGSGSKGPNGVIFQPKARTVLITENGTDAFKTIADASNTVIRVTLPAGWDLNAYNGSLAASQILDLIYTGTAASNRPFSTAPSIVRVQPKLGSTITNAFVDIDVGALGTPTNAVRRIIGLVFKPNALVVPSSVSSFAATVSVVYTGATNTRNASITDDTTLQTLGTVALGSGCSTFLTLNYCDDALSSYGKSTYTETYLQSDSIANGANLTTFSDSPSTIIRLDSNTPADVILPDLCVEEGIADALPIGQGVDGVPNIFGIGALTTNGVGELHLASSYQGVGTETVGLKAGITPTVFVSDSSVTATPSAVSANEAVISIAEGSVTGRSRPFKVKTEFRVSGLKMNAVTSATFASPAQSFVAWFEAPAAQDYVIGNVLPIASREDSVNGNFLANVEAGTEANKMANNFYNGRTIDTTTLTTSNVAFNDTNDTAASNNDLSLVFNNTNAARILNAVTIIADDEDYLALNSDTVLSVSIASISGSTDVLATISAAAGSLEAGSTILVASSGTGPQDTVTVPVLDDGSFKATVRAATTQQLSVTQSPDSSDPNVPKQRRILSVTNQNVEPKLVSATVEDIGLGAVPKKGLVPVVFTVVASGKVGSTDFVPTASQLKLGGRAVTAVTGSTTKFIGLADLSKTGGTKLVATVTGHDSSEVTIDVDTSTVTKTGAPKITSVKQTASGYIRIAGTNLSRSDLVFGYITSAGTYTEVSLRATTKADRKAGTRRSAEKVTIPETAIFGVVVAPARGVSSTSNI